MTRPTSNIVRLILRLTRSRQRRAFDAYIAGLRAEAERRKASPDYETITDQVGAVVTDQVYSRVDALDATTFVRDEVSGPMTVRMDPETGFVYDRATGERVDRHYGPDNPYPGAREDGYRALRESREISSVYDQVRADEAAQIEQSAAVAAWSGPTERAADALDSEGP